MKERVLLHMEYRKGTKQVLPDKVKASVLAHVNSGYEIAAIEITADGALERDGQEYVFHDLRVLLKNKP